MGYRSKHAYQSETTESLLEHAAFLREAAKENADLAVDLAAVEKELQDREP